tara:strand:- start:278 stop:1369 length:1092 start_codon:yes stop_codon:yes gene_type:complete
MIREYTSLGLMSGTSGDGVDASIIQSDGENKYQVILDKYFEYDQDTYKNIHKLKEKINNSKDLENLLIEIEKLEKKITLFHAKVVDNIKREKVDFIGFHGQTIFHNPKEKISKQLGDGHLLSKLTGKKVVYNFRENDLKNGGQGAPLTPIFHKLLRKKLKLELPVAIMNVGGIANVTIIDINENIYSKDIGPGNCLIDQWIRSNSEKKYDEDGKIAKLGKINTIILNQAIENFESKDGPMSYDVKDFDLSFVRGLSIEDGAATLTEYTSKILIEKLKTFSNFSINNIIISGGGRKNKLLIKSIEEKIDIPVKSIDNFGVNGDFVESQAFAYLAIRSYLNLPISFPKTTGCYEPCSGGILVKTK